MSAATSRPMFGNLVQTKSPGLMGTGTVPTAILFAGVMISVMTMTFAGLIPALVLFAVTVVAFAVLGTPLGRGIGTRWAFWRNSSAGGTAARSGLFSRNANPRLSLPGALAKKEMLSYTDAYGNLFGVIRTPILGGTYTVVARCVAEGVSMQDSQIVDQWVSSYGQFIAAMGDELGLISVKVIVDTAPEAGSGLAARITAHRAPGASRLAAAVMDEVGRTYPAEESYNQAYVELTYKGSDLDRKNDREKILSELSRRVPLIEAAIAQTGGGTVSMMTPSGLAEVVRVAYDPGAVKALEDTRLAGHPETVEWSDAGPRAAQERWSFYAHDDAVSVSFEMSSPPRHAVTSDVLGRLVAPHSNFLRKRVALIYEPYGVHRSATIAERDVSTAVFASSQKKKRMSATDKAVVAAAAHSAEQIAAGAGMAKFSVLVTITTPLDEDDFWQAQTGLKSRTALQLRPANGTQAAAFAATLPVGYLPWEETQIPKSLQEWM